MTRESSSQSLLFLISLSIVWRVTSSGERGQKGETGQRRVVQDSLNERPGGAGEEERTGAQITGKGGFVSGVSQAAKGGSPEEEDPSESASSDGEQESGTEAGMSSSDSSTATLEQQNGSTPCIPRRSGGSPPPPRPRETSACGHRSTDAAVFALSDSSVARRCGHRASGEFRCSVFERAAPTRPPHVTARQERALYDAFQTTAR